MAIPSRQIGSSQEANILWNISKQLEIIARIGGGGGGGTITGGGAVGQISFWNGATSVTGSNALSWDDVNKGLTISGNKYNVGTYWKTIPGTNFPQQNFRGLAYGNGLFVAVANRLAAGNSTTTSIATSPDGVTWTYRTLPVITGLTNIIYQNGIFIAVGQINQRGFYSYDGINWVVTNNLVGQIYGITYGRDKFVACKIDNSQARISISYNGKDWTNVTTPLAMDLQLTSVAYGNDVFVAVGSNNAANSIWYSPDGITWTAATRSAGTTTHNVCYGKGLFIVTADGGKIFTSPDGINWTQRDTPLSGLIWKCIYAEGVFIAAGAFAGSQNKFIYSVDGITWLEANTPVLNDWGAFAYGNGMVLCVSYNGPNTSALIVKSGELNSFIPQNDNFTHGRQSFTDNVALVQSSRLGIGTNAPLASLVVASGNTLLGQNTDGGQRLQVYGDTLLRGLGNTSATNALLVQNSVQNEIARFENGGNVFITTGILRVSTIVARAGQNLIFEPGGSSSYIQLKTFPTSGSYFLLSGDTFAPTGNTITNLLANQNFSPTSGTAVYNNITLSNTINQTGGANGITRGLFVNPTLTSAADFRAIETTNGKIVFGNLPTSSAGLPTGALWNNGGVVNIV